jgi:hypothetical protein
VGDDDTFFLNDAVELMQRFLQHVTNPPADATFRYGHNQPHGWSPYTTQQLVTIMAEYMGTHAPAGADTGAWLPGRTVVTTPGSHVAPEDAGFRGVRPRALG